MAITIKEIHPEDAFYVSKESFIGRKVKRITDLHKAEEEGFWTGYVKLAATPESKEVTYYFLAVKFSLKYPQRNRLGVPVEVEDD